MAIEGTAVATGHTVTINGQAGAFRWGYRLAASVGAWQIRQLPPPADAPPGTLPRRELVASIVGDVQLFAIRQRPLAFVVTRPGVVAWRWPVLSLELGGDRICAMLGPREKDG